MDVKKLPGWLYHAEHEPRIFYEQGVYDAALAAGWVDSPAKIEAVAEPDNENSAAPTGLPPEIAAMGLDDLKAYARGLGIQFVKIRLDTLQAKVAEALAAQAPALP
jgi:hypothetical protein